MIGQQATHTWIMKTKIKIHWKKWIKNKNKKNINKKEEVIMKLQEYCQDREINYDKRTVI